MMAASPRGREETVTIAGPSLAVCINERTWPASWHLFVAWHVSGDTAEPMFAHRRPRGHLFYAGGGRDGAMGFISQKGEFFKSVEAAVATLMGTPNEGAVQ